MMTNKIESNLIDLLTGNYSFAKNSRSDEFETYSDFKKRFVETNPAIDVLESFVKTYFSIGKKEVAGFFWLASSYNIHLYKKLPEVLKSQLEDYKKKEFLMNILEKMKIWPSSYFSIYSDEDKRSIVSYIKRYGIKFEPQYKVVLDS